MVLKIILCFCLTLVLSLHLAVSDNGFSEHLIDQSFNSPSGVNISDINQDGNPDILGASWNGGLITVWYHQGDTPASWNRENVASGFTGASFVSSADLNNDSLPEILGAAWEANEIAYWIRQNDSIWIKQVIDSNFTSAHEVCPGDLDQDGDTDVIAASAGLNQITWWENQGGDPLVWNKQVICSTMTGARSVDIGDLDRDGDLDLVGAAADNHQIRWWESDGQTPPSYTEHLITSEFNGAHMVRIGDVNNDSYPDIATVGWQINQVAVWINDGINQTSWDKIMVDAGFPLAMGVDFADFDQDGHLDIVATSLQGYLAWYKNDGQTPPAWIRNFVDMNLPGAWPLARADINGDGYLDIISGANYSTYVNWYENILYTGIGEFNPTELIHSKISFCIQPNPFSSATTIYLNLPESRNIEISIYNIYGAKINQLVDQPLSPGSYQFIWNGQNQLTKLVMPGIYFVQIKYDNIYLSTEEILYIP